MNTDRQPTEKIENLVETSYIIGVVGIRSKNLIRCEKIRDRLKVKVVIKIREKINWTHII